MKKYTFKGIAYPLIILALAYLFGAFCEADWNIKHWHYLMRICVALFGSGFAISANIGVYLINNP